MKKLLTLIVIILVVIGIVYFAKSSDANVIKIGVVAPLTGGKSQIGEGLKQAITLAQKDFGKTNKNYKFIYEDSGGESAKGASAVQKLISVDKVNALISITSQDGNLTSLAADHVKIPHIGIANDHGVSNGDYNFVHWTPVESQVELFVDQVKKRNIKKIAALVENNDASIATMSSLEKHLKGTGIELVFVENFNKGITDFHTIIQKMKLSKPDLVILETFSPAIEIVATQLKEMGNTAPVSSITYIGTAKDLTKFEGSWYVSGGQPSAEFSAEFKAQAGYDSTIGAHYGYEVAKIYLTIFENNTDISSANIAAKIKNFDFKNFANITGVTGMDADGQFISPGALVLVKDGKNVEIKE